MTKTRTDDERTLTMLAMRCNGTASIRIAADFGIHPRTVCEHTLKVMRADLKESGERKSDVLRGYPIMRKSA